MTLLAEARMNLRLFLRGFFHAERPVYIPASVLVQQQMENRRRIAHYRLERRARLAVMLRRLQGGRPTTNVVEWKRCV